MKQIQILTTNMRDLQEVNQHMTDFLDSYEQKSLPLPFLPNTLNSKFFFIPLNDFNLFTTEQCLNKELKDLLFLGELLLIDHKKLGNLGSTVVSVQAAYGINDKHTRSYAKLRHCFDRMPIGNIIHYSIMEPFFADEPITARTAFGDRTYRGFCKKNPVYARYHYVHHFVWCNEHYERILN